MKYPIDAGVTHIEVAFANFDQWTLTVGVRAYKEQSVMGMVHVLFRGVRGFRYLDEGDMLQYRFPRDCTKNYVQEIVDAYWSQQESNYGNIVSDGHKEYLITGGNECICVLSGSEPVVVKDL
jgi:glycosidase